MYADRPLSISSHACTHYFSPVLSEMEVGLHQPLSFVFPKDSWKEEDCLSPLSVEVVQYAMFKVVIVPCMHASKSIWELLK